MAQQSRVRIWAPALAALFLLWLGLAASAAASGGTVSAWGYNGYGAIGNGTFSSEGCICVDTPVPVVGLSEVTEAVGGRETHALAVLADGTAKSWGDNAYGQLGTGTTSNRYLPGAVAGLTNVVAVAGGEFHSLALLSNGTVMAWGRNQFGQLGLGSTVGPQTCGKGAPCSTTPVQVPGISGAVAVAAGDHFSLALLSNGTVMAWGEEQYGQLGNGRRLSEGCECVPTPAVVPGLANAISIDASEYAAIALLADGTVRDWGYNPYGQAGDGSQTPNGCECSPVATPSGVTTAVAASSGDTTNLAVLANGTVVAWGSNKYGQLGTGLNTGPEECDGGTPCSKTPVAVGSLGGVRDVVGIDRNAVALLNDGTASSWGYGYYGELGNGKSLSGAETPIPGPVLNVAGASAIGGGEYMGYALIGPSQTLSVAFAGAGSGSVTGRRLSCPPRCAGTYPQGQVALLNASPAGFAGFSGPCTGTGICQAKMDVDQVVTATFGVPKGTAITRAKIRSPKRKATFSFSAPGAITGYQCMLIKPKPKRKPKHRAKASKKGNKRKQEAEIHFLHGAQAYKHLKSGRYTFKVRALDVIGADAQAGQARLQDQEEEEEEEEDLVAGRDALHGPAVAIRVGEEDEVPPGEARDLADLDTAIGEPLAGRVDVVDDELEPLDRAGLSLGDAFSDRDRACGPGRGQLYEAKAVLHPVVVVGGETGPGDVELLRPVDVRNRHRDELEPEVHVQVLPARGVSRLPG